MKNEKVFYYHSDFTENPKKSRYTVSGLFENDTLHLAYCRKGKGDNFSKHFGRELSTKRLLNKEEKYYRTVTVNGNSTKDFITESRNFINSLKGRK